MNRETQKALLSAAGRYIRKLFGEMDIRLKGVEDQVAQLPDLVARGIDGIRKPEDGKSVTIEEVQPILAELVKEAVGQIPAPTNGTSVTVEDVLPALKAHVDELVAAIPRPKDGESVPVDVVQRMVDDAVARIELPQPGKDGKSVTVEEVLPELRDLVKRTLEDWPRPKDGEPGQDVDQGKAVESVLDALAPRIGQFLAEKDLEIERRIHAAIEKAIERLPRPKDGIDAVPVDSFEALLCEDGRTVTFSFGAGETKRSKDVTFPIVIDRGLFKEGQRYERGDGVTWGGSFWIAQKDDPIGKPGESEDWRLAVKKGRDAKGGG